MILYEDRKAGISVERLTDDVVHVELIYPRQNPVKAVEIGLECVRAADCVRVAYDFDRDGWSIQQAGVFAWEGAGEAVEDWREMAFVPAWGRQCTCVEEDGSPRFRGDKPVGEWSAGDETEVPRLLRHDAACPTFRGVQLSTTPARKP